VIIRIRAGCCFGGLCTDAFVSAANFVTRGAGRCCMHVRTARDHKEHFDVVKVPRRSIVAGERGRGRKKGPDLFTHNK